ncbi:hypothetical protein FHX09_000709 [Rhizobium sp. BK538]|nr:hypothetical protein [Rhizobium sp. BK060]MBB4166890.1 hypothetical protein [Rhizobium sp. BK538]TCM67121.1 hypothetical protein EV291_13642 [Rhizobium sp. BK068]
MRLASFNVENLFDRAKAMNLETRADGRVVLDRLPNWRNCWGRCDLWRR